MPELAGNARRPTIPSMRAIAWSAVHAGRKRLEMWITGSTNMRYFLIGSLLSFALLATLEYLQPWATASEPTPAQRQAALDAGWIDGTDGYYRAIYGSDAY